MFIQPLSSRSRQRMMGSVVVVMRVGLVCKKTSHSDANHPVFLAPKPRETCCNQRVAYRIGNLSNADISDFFVYRIVYRIEPPISCISIFSKPMNFLSFFAENSKNSLKILKIRRKFAENSENSPKIPQKEGLLWGPHIVSYRIVSRKKPSYRIESKKSLSLFIGWGIGGLTCGADVELISIYLIILIWELTPVLIPLGSPSLTRML